MIRGKIADGSGGIATLVAQTEEDFDACLEWEGYGRLRTEMVDGLTMDGILLVVKGDDNLSGQAAAESERKWETVSLRMAFF